MSSQRTEKGLNIVSLGLNRIGESTLRLVIVSVFGDLVTHLHTRHTHTPATLTHVHPNTHIPTHKARMPPHTGTNTHTHICYTHFNTHVDPYPRHIYLNTHTHTFTIRPFEFSSLNALSRPPAVLQLPGWVQFGPPRLPLGVRCPRQSFPQGLGPRAALQASQAVGLPLLLGFSHPGRKSP